MYLRKWTKIPFYEGFDLYRKLNMLNHLDHEPVIYLNRPPTMNQGYELKENLTDSDERRMFDKLFARYPDLKLLPLLKTRPGSSINEPVVVRFSQKYQDLRRQGFSESKAFEAAEEAFQSSMQRKIDQTLIANNLGVNNQARSLMTYYEQKLEYESRLKARRVERDLAIKDMSFDPDTQIILKKYQKALIRVTDRTTKDVVKHNTAQEEEFVARSRNVFECYYARVAAKDKMSGLTDEQLIQSIRESPTKIKNRVKSIVKQCERLGVKLENNELIIPESIPQYLKDKLKSPQVTAALMYQDLGYEFQHRKHLDQLQVQLSKLRDEKNRIERIEDGTTEEQRQNAEKEITDVLNKADLKINQTYKLFETQEERHLRLQIKWTYRQIDLLELELSKTDAHGQAKVEEKRKQHQERLNQMISKLRQVKHQIEYHSQMKTGELVFEEHAALVSEPQFKQTGLTIDKVQQYFRQPYELRRLTQSAQINDDIIHNLIRVKQLKSDVSKLHSAELENQLTEADIEKLIEDKITEQYKIQAQRQRNKLTSRNSVDEVEESKEQAELTMELPDDIVQLKKRLVESQAEELKKAEQERKSQEALNANKNNRKKKS